MLVFSDFECPFCRRFYQSALKPALIRHASEVAFIHRNLPLTYHRFARPAAAAAECAGNQGRYLPMHDMLFRNQDSLGLKPFLRMAAEAKIADLPEFTRCINSGEPLKRIEHDRKIALGFGATGTPSVLIDGVLLGTVPDSAELEHLIALRLSGVPLETVRMDGP